MLYSIDSGKYVSRIPHKKDFDKWMKNLSDKDYKKIEDEINSKIDQNDINTAGWLPGYDWTGTVYEAIYKACAKNLSQSGLFFGLIIFNILMNCKDRVWCYSIFNGIFYIGNLS